MGAFLGGVLARAWQPPAFAGSVSRLDPATRVRMSSSWRPGCPVGLDQLRLLHLRYWGYDGRPHEGEMVVNVDVAVRVSGVLRQLYDDRFPIQQMRLVDDFGGDDDASMTANNSSAFNCRPVAGHPGSWSQHAYGRAVDLNPLTNPYVLADGTVSPPAGAPYRDRSLRAPGLIAAGGPAVRAFCSVGWGWGGAWSGGKDYQHFSANGR